MTGRATSFFEQDRTAKQNPDQWQRSRTSQAPPDETSVNGTRSKLPTPTTAEVGMKLKAFQFVPGRPEGTSVSGQHSMHKGENKENASSGANEVENTDMRDIYTMPSIPSAFQRSAERTTSSQSAPAKTPQLPHANTFPSTPGARLPLEDLIGNFDENATRDLPNELSPEEQVGWIPNSSSTSLTPNRRRKRARSSSPSCPNTSSQRQEASVSFGGHGTPSEKKALDADPTTSLWKSYGAGNDSAETLKLPELNMLFQPSPKPLETPAKGAAFRRWASTGNDWPSSRNKRRRMDGKASLSFWQDGQAGSSGKSKIAGMVEKIQESLAANKTPQSAPEPGVGVDAPSSSSPLPETGAGTFGDSSAASPLHGRQRQPATRSPRLNPILPSQLNKPVQAVQAVSLSEPLPVTHDARSAQLHGDSVIPAPLHLQNKAPLPAYRRPAMSRTQSGSGRQYPTKQVPPPAPPPAPVAPALGNDLDEFGDEFDLSVEDLEELVSQKPPHQRGTHEIHTHLNPQPEQPGDQHSLLVPQCKPQAGMAGQASTAPENDDEFDDDDLDEDTIAEAEMSAAQVYRMSAHERNSNTPRSPHKFRDPSSTSTAAVSSQEPQLQRLIVKQVIDGEYSNPSGRRCLEKLLIGEDERTSRTTAITLRDSWANTYVATGNIVHIAHLRSQISMIDTPSTPAGQVFITDDERSPLLIVHPDHMLSATTVADSFDCARKAVLQDRIKATGETSKAMVYGKVLHEIFQQALSSNRWDTAYLADLANKTVHSHVEDLWQLGMRDAVLAVEETRAKMGELSAWANIYVAARPSSDATVDDRQGEKVWMSVSKLIAIEEHIWSPLYGLKGNIDATIQSTVIDHPKEAAKKLIAPFEVKTGRTTQSPAHRAQTALYTLLLSDRYDASVKAGILYYLESSTMSRIAPPLNEIRQMIQQRNRLAAYIHRVRHPKKGDDDVHMKNSLAQAQDIEQSGLPTLLRNPFKCGRCYAQQACFSFHALVENGTADSAGMVDDGKKNHSMVWQEAVGHLALSAKNKTEADKLKSWFAKWDRLLTFEESEMSRFRKELWTMSSAEREAIGRCFGNLVLDRDLSTTAAAVSQMQVDGIEGSGGKINRYTYVFKQATQKAGMSFAEGTQLVVGEPVVVSSERGQWALANGYVVAATSHDITVAVDRKLGDSRGRLDGFDEAANQAFRGTMTVGTDESAGSFGAEQTRYRLDKDEFSNGLALVRNNLVSLMSSQPIHAKRRQHIIFSGSPSFSSPLHMPILSPSQLSEMNEDQRAAVAKVLNAQDYALVLGMPGTGKTTTIAHIIRALLAEDKTILLTSFTHTAVDNILLKIRAIAPPNSILRLGVHAKINAEVQKFCRLAATPRTTIDEIEEAYMGSRIVATTCMGTNHAVLSRRTFDVCIIDEASQITLPTALGPLLHAHKFVLVGDHYQLPPLVQNRQALEGGLAVSLFRQLSEEHPEAIATLGKQYRMCRDIMSLSNALIYNGQLRCGNDAVAQKTLSVDSLRPLQDLHSSPPAIQDCLSNCWLEDLIQPQRKVVFANIDPLGKEALETLTSGKNITNQLEATLTVQLVLSLLRLGVPGGDIGVITLYRSQLALMRQQFRLAGVDSQVEIDSADRFQGRDKECIILSMVRSNEQGIVGDLLKDWRRVNVAFTRARSKLIVFGSRRTLVNNNLLAKFLALVDEHGWAMDLPYGANTSHTFDFSSPPATGLEQRDSSSPCRTTPRGLNSRSIARTSPRKGLSLSPSKILGPSTTSGNRSPGKLTSQGKVTKLPSKTIKGSAHMKGKLNSGLMKEHIAIEILEDLTADDT